MNNVFNDFSVGVKFDLKGSVTGRTKLPEGKKLETLTEDELKTALKDNDFRKLFKTIKLDERPKG